MNVIDRLEKIVDFEDTTNLKYQIAEYLLFNPHFVELNMKELAKAIPTSSPSIMRFVKDLNYSSYEEFKEYYQQNLRYVQALNVRLKNEIISNVTLNAKEQILNQYFKKAKRIVICGGMYEMASLMSIQDHYIQENKWCVLLGQDNKEQQLKVLNKLDEDDLIIIVSASMNYNEFKSKNMLCYSKSGIIDEIFTCKSNKVYLSMAPACSSEVLCMQVDASFEDFYSKLAIILNRICKD